MIKPFSDWAGMVSGETGKDALAITYKIHKTKDGERIPVAKNDALGSDKVTWATYIPLNFISDMEAIARKSVIASIYKREGVTVTQVLNAVTYEGLKKGYVEYEEGKRLPVTTGDLLRRLSEFRATIEQLVRLGYGNKSLDKLLAVL